MSNQPGVSSYDKIFNHLIQTQDFAALKAAWHERLAKVGPVRYELSYVEDEQGKQEVRPQFYATFPDDLTVWSSGNVSKDVLVDGLLSKDEIERVAKDNFGTERCKTYFCKLEDVLGGRSEGSKKVPEERRRKKVYSFVARVREMLEAESKAEIDAARARLASSFHEAVDSEALARDKKAFFERHVIEQIKAVVLKFNDKVGRHVIKAALNEVIVHSLMEC
jgi:hypothetical protein